MSGRYGDKEPYFSIRFDHMIYNIGTLAAGKCYTVSYLGKKYGGLADTMQPQNTVTEVHGRAMPRVGIK
jgi:hypothetical protein